MPIISPFKRIVQQVWPYLWSKELHIERRGSQLMVLILASAAGMSVELLVHFDVLSIPRLLVSHGVTVFYNVPKIDITNADASLGRFVVMLAVARVIFGAVIAVADAIFYKKITKNPFDWESLINVAVINCIFILTLFTLANPALTKLLFLYDETVAKVPTVASFAGLPGLLIACLLGDFAFYWSHRWCHKIRVFWNLGHINHHRSRNLSQLTHSVDPQTFVLDTAGGKVFALLLLPFLTRLFAVDLRDCGWLLIAALVIDTWTNPSHSVVLYYLENKFAVLRAFRWILVTPAVHFTHHSREQAHNLSDGCNFAARLSIWDRLFGTYAVPPRILPDTGLFGDDADYCKTPLRYVLKPWVRLLDELRLNQVRHWPRILFAHASYEPPVQSRIDP
jgi:sterol desaturase/sphingolipid hydroxylase (fatty acid hydroxylase superfamily)